MYPSETLDNDCTAAKMTRFQCRMFTTAALTIVVFTDDAPRHVLRLQPSTPSATNSDHDQHHHTPHYSQH